MITRKWLFLLMLLPACAYAGVPTKLIKIPTFDGFELNGELTLPDETVLGAVVILQGSGNVGSDGDVSSALLGQGYRGGATNLSEQVADRLALSNIASLRYSKRGKDNSGELIHQTLPYLAKDAEAAVSFLKNQFPFKKIGMLGLSEGATLAMLVASTNFVDSLFLLALPTKPIEEILAYQFFEWPTELLMNHFDPNHTGYINLDVLKSVVPKPPLVDLLKKNTTWESMDLKYNGKISTTDSLLPTYQSLYLTDVAALMITPQFKNWYQSYKEMGTFEEIAARMKTRSVFVYQGMNDAQLRWRWLIDSIKLMPVIPSLRLYPDLGHCFSPMDGAIGEVKTSGPLSEILLDQLTADVLLGLKQ